MQLLGYGEDALTYWALTQRLTDILTAFDDKPSDSGTVFFRPSFGRRSSAGKDVPTQRGAQFGEFDAIVATDKAIYLIEAKWTKSGELEPDAISLRPEQRRRHQVFRKYIELWAQGSYGKWEDFTAAQATIVIGGPHNESEVCQVAPTGSRLASNLEAVLKRIALPGKPVRDVVLIVHPGTDGASSRRRGPEGFDVVEMSCPAMVGPYIRMAESV